MAADLDNEWGEWKLTVVQGDGHELVAMTLSIIGESGAESFFTTMPFDHAREFANGILSLTGAE